MPISLPKFFQRAFAQNGGKQDVPITGDTSGGRASYDVGFPPVTRIPIVAGGIPPFGTDFNGVLYDLSQAIQYVQSGVAFPFNQDFATAIGGYEIGAIVSDASNKSLLWINGTASNTSFPSGWDSFKVGDPTDTVRGVPLSATMLDVTSRSADVKITPPSLLPRLLRIKQITANTTYSKPSDVGAILVYATGAGGGGGGVGPSTSAASVGGGGGGGSTAIKFIPTPAASYVITIGAGGSGGTGLQSGLNGGSTSFGGVCVGTGGTGGGYGTPRASLLTSGAPGMPVSGSIGDIIQPGSAGMLGFAGPNYAISPPPGQSLFSLPPGYAEETGTTVAPGGVSSGFGGGGAGARGVNNGATGVGGNGSNGVVYILEYA